MKELLNRFSFETLKINGQTVTCAVIIWLVVLGCTLASINSQPFNRSQRLFWIVFVICAPLVGLFFYLLWSVKYAVKDSAMASRKK